MPAGFSLFRFFVAGKYIAGKMKVIFYRALLKGANNLTPTEKIVYSFLVSKSVSNTEFIFESDGTTISKASLDFYFNNEQWTWFDLHEINNSKLSIELHIARVTAIKCVSKLKELRLIKYDNDDDCSYIYVNRELLDEGYFELQKLDIIGGDLVVFYSYLKNRGQRYGYCIDTFKNRMAQDLGKTTIAITRMLQRLYKLNLAKRLDNGKLLIN